MRTVMKCAGIGLMVIGVYWATPRLMIALLKDDVYTGSILAVFTFSFFPVAWVLTMIPETYRRHGPGNRRLSD